MQYKQKLVMQPWENGKNLISDPILTTPHYPHHPHLQTFFSWVLPLLVVRHCSKLLSYAILRKTNEPNLKKWQKKFGPDFGPFGPNLGLQIFLWVLPNVLPNCRHCCTVSLYAISRKTKETKLEKMTKKTIILDSSLATLAQIRTTKLFSSKIWRPQPLDIMVSYNMHNVRKK